MKKNTIRRLQSLQIISNMFKNRTGAQCTPKKYKSRRQDYEFK